MSIVEFESGRQAAMLEVVAGYQRGLVKLHPDDHEERAWFLLRLKDVWTIAGLSAVQPVPPPHSHADQQVGTWLHATPSSRLDTVGL